MVYRCRSMKEKACTTCCTLGVLLLIVATLLVHVSLSTLVPAITGLPDNLVKGLNDVLNFGQLEAEVDKIKVHASDALAKCSITNPASVCDNPPTNDPTRQDTGAELAAIRTIFDSTLDTVKKVTGDKYLGLANFQGADSQLTEIQNDLKQFDNITMPVECGATNSLFCGLYKSSSEIKNGMQPIKDGINEITENKALKDFKANADYLKYLHALPYIMWLGMIFYLCFFVSEKAVSVCSGGSGKACVACCCHSLFFLISLIISVVVVFAGIMLVGYANNNKLEGALKGEPTIVELLDHLQDAFPAFYDVVFKDLLAGLKKFFDSQLVFVVADVVVLVHTCGTCVAGPYKDSYSEP